MSLNLFLREISTFKLTILFTEYSDDENNYLMNCIWIHQGSPRIQARGTTGMRTVKGTINVLNCKYVDAFPYLDHYRRFYLSRRDEHFHHIVDFMLFEKRIPKDILRYATQFLDVCQFISS